MVSAPKRTVALPTQNLCEIAEKVRADRRLSDADALALFQSDDLEALSQIGSIARARRHGSAAFYIINRHINYSNICVLDCDFCAFGKRKRDADAYELSIDEMVERARTSLGLGATEIHIVGGLHPTWKFSVYLEMLRALRALGPELSLKAFTAVEILHFAWVAKTSVEDVLEQLRDAGLNCLTGGGAEIFAPDVRKQICRGKETGEEWLQVHRAAHRLDIRSTATMLFGHLESYEDRVDHLRQLRELQDETGGFLAFLPLAFQPAHKLAHLLGPDENETLKNIAVCRAYLDNVEHIKAYWISYGLDLARRALAFGADDLDGTIEEERIYHMAGADSPLAQTADALKLAIVEAGLQPVLRDSFYRKISV
ncbi:MAG: aminofutalosine synthase MqnE [Verrucomicrobiota bacterium]|nr:aminofutalosine synthase MqnE [Verrucomicrobiota bacterium]